jgi:hypothetical protein
MLLMRAEPPQLFFAEAKPSRSPWGSGLTRAADPK